MKVTLSFGSVPSGEVVVDFAAWVGPCAEPPTYRGGRVEVAFFSSEEKNSVALEGEVEAVRALLSTALEHLDLHVVHAKALAAQKVGSSIKCVFCGTWFDVNARGGHPDGKGNLCPGVEQ